MSELPDHWTLAKVGDTAEYINGLAFKPSDWLDEGRPIIRIQNLTNPDKPLNRTNRDVDDCYVVRNGDILVSWSATLDAFIWNRGEAVLNQHIFRVVPNDALVDAKYLFHALRLLIRELVESEHLHGSTMKHINRGPFLAHRFPLAPRKEQSRIASKLDALNARVYRARHELDRIPTLVEHYKQAILAKAFSGADGAEDIPLVDLIADGPQNGLYLPKSQYGTGTPILRIENYGFDGAEPIADWSKVKIEPDVAAKYALAPGDIVINRVNSPSHLGKSLLIVDAHVPAVFESNMMRMRLSDRILPEYAQLFLGSELGRKQLIADAKWAVNQASINQGDVCRTILPVPSIAIQSCVIAEIHGAMAWLKKIAAEYAHAEHLLPKLDKAILAKAFRGELVPQDPNDEPASALLKRIKEGRLTENGERRRGRRSQA